MTDVSAGHRLTGERTLPGIWHENYWFRRHEAVYAWAAGLTAGRVVLDAGCGEGYGSAALLASGARAVVGLDYDAGTASHVGVAYPQVRAVRGNLVALPLRTGSVGAVVSLQTIEHVWDQAAFVRESARVLEPGGLVALSTPNRLTFSPGAGAEGRPLNPFHARELDAAELTALARGHLTAVAVLGVHHGTRLQRYERERGTIVDALLAAPADEWPPELATLVRSVTAADFEVVDGCVKGVESALDLVLVGRRP